MEGSVRRDHITLIKSSAAAVIPAEAGIHAASLEQWTPAYAGETIVKTGVTLDASRMLGYVRHNAPAAPLTQVQIGGFFISCALALFRTLSDAVGVPKEVLVSWTHAMVYLRNLSAHHGRVWNHKLAVQAMVPRKWAPAEFATDRIFRMASVLEYLERKTLGQSLAHSWSDLLNDFPAELQASMGVPANWRELWDGWNVLPGASCAVIPAKAGIQATRVFPAKAGNHAASQEQWSPAYAGKTDSGAGVQG